MKHDLEQFKQAVENGEYPRKCLKCYGEGVKFCRFWSLNFNCGELDEYALLERVIMLKPKG